MLQIIQQYKETVITYKVHSANDALLDTNRKSVTLVYVDSTKGWLFTDEHDVSDLQKATFTSVLGGTVTTSGNDRIHTFTGDGTFSVASVGNTTIVVGIKFLI